MADDDRSAAAEGRLSLRPLLALAAATAVLLVVFASRYGYHRDELYFLAAGRHLAWGFPDQGPLTPALAWLMDGLAPGSLTALRVPPALMAGGVVLLTGLTAREMRGTRRAQVIAASSAMAASIVLVAGHGLSTTSFDLLAWAAVGWLLARAIRTGDRWLLLPAGVVCGVALLNKPLIAFLLAALLLGLAVRGPRSLLSSPWLWAGAAVAALLWLPNLLWQAGHGWPQMEISSAITDGGSASSQPRWALVPFQALLVSPVLVPVWVAGLIGLLRHPQLRAFGSFAWAWLALVAIFTLTGGKPYYLAGLFPVLLAAGAVQADAWLARGATRPRRWLLGGALVSGGLVSAAAALPLLPARHAEPVVAMNADVGETIGWPDLVASVARVYEAAGDGAVIYAANYGQAGALRRFGPDHDLPDAHSGHNGFADWGPPPDAGGRVVLVGEVGASRRALFRDCHVEGRIRNAAGIENEEWGAPISLCEGTAGAWSEIWPKLRRLG